MFSQGPPDSCKYKEVCIDPQYCAVAATIQPRYTCDTHDYNTVQYGTMPFFSKLRSNKPEEKKYISVEEFHKRNKEYEEAHEKRKNSVSEGYKDWSRDTPTSSSATNGSGGWNTPWL